MYSGGLGSWLVYSIEFRIYGLGFRVVFLYILWEQTGYNVITLGPKYIVYSCMDFLGRLVITTCDSGGEKAAAGFHRWLGCAGGGG